MLGLAFALGSVVAVPARAQDPDQAKALFEQVIKTPGDAALSLRHAEAAAAAGDYEAAIGSLERVLFFNSNLTSVRLELGILYFRLGSYDMAHGLLRPVVATPGADPILRSRAEAYLVEIEKRLSPNRTSGQIQVGARYDTNANAGATSGTSGTLLDERSVKKSDSSAFANVVLHNVIDFGNQRGDTWESSLRGYGSGQRELHYLNIGLFDVQTGPRLSLFPESLNGWSIRPYVGAGGTMLRSEQYLMTRSAGAALTWSPEPGWLAEVGGDFTRRHYSDTPDYPTASEQTGDVRSGWAAFSGLLPLGLRWSARLSLADASARETFEAYFSRGADFALSYAFYLPVGSTEWRVSLSPYVGVASTSYDGPDPNISSTTLRKDFDRKVGILVDTQFTKNWSLGMRVQYSNTNSSLGVYDTDNVMVVGGPIFKF